MTSPDNRPPSSSAQRAGIDGAPGPGAVQSCDRSVASTKDDAETELFEILELFPHDQDIHAGIISRPNLSDAVLTRLVALLSDTQLDDLFARHPLPMQSRHEILKRSPRRPPWWRRALLAAHR